MVLTRQWTNVIKGEQHLRIKSSTSRQHTNGINHRHTKKSEQPKVQNSQGMNGDQSAVSGGHTAASAASGEAMKHDANETTLKRHYRRSRSADRIAKLKQLSEAFPSSA